VIEIIPAVNATTLRELKRQVKIASALSHLIDVDISDGKFTGVKTVPLKAIESLTPAQLSIHYMGKDPMKAIDKLPKNVFRFTFHYEAAKELTELICNKLLALKIHPSIALNPETKVKDIKQFIKKGIHFHILTVHPGKSGQKLLKSALRKVRQIKKISPKTIVGIDGGVNMSTAKFIRLYPLDYVSATSVFMKSKNPELAFKRLQSALKQ